MRTLAGTYAPLGTVEMKGIWLPAFDKHRVIAEHQFHVFEGDCHYNVILGGDFLEKIGMNLLYKTLEIEWLGNVLPMETIDKPDRVAAHMEQYLAQLEFESTGIELDNYLSSPILEVGCSYIGDDSLFAPFANPTSRPTSVTKQAHKAL